jgi:hypothetical protein
MNNNPLFLIVDDSFDRMFLTDKSGKTVFFPWGIRKQGYYIKNRNFVVKAKKFYKTSFSISFILLGIALSFLGKSFWGVVSSMIIWSGGWYLSYFFYVSRIVKSLQPAKVSYNELIHAKYESDDSENQDLEEQTETQFPARWSKPISQINNDPFLGVKRIWYRLSPGQLFFLFILIGIGIIMVSANFIKHEFGKSPIDFVIAFFVSVIWGFAGFVFVKNIEIEKKDWWGFLNWKFPMILITVACWSFAVYSLYKVFVMIFV